MGSNFPHVLWASCEHRLSNLREQEARIEPDFSVPIRRTSRTTSGPEEAPLQPLWCVLAFPSPVKACHCELPAFFHGDKPLSKQSSKQATSPPVWSYLPQAVSLSSKPSGAGSMDPTITCLFSEAGYPRTEKGYFGRSAVGVALVCSDNSVRPRLERGYFA